MKERQIALPSVIEKKKLDNTDQWMSLMDKLNPEWRQDKRLQMQAKDRLASAHMFDPPLVITQGEDGAPWLESASLTVRQVADSLKIQNKIRGKIDDAMLQRAERKWCSCTASCLWCVTTTGRPWRVLLHLQQQCRPLRLCSYRSGLRWKCHSVLSTVSSLSSFEA